MLKDVLKEMMGEKNNMPEHDDLKDAIVSFLKKKPRPSDEEIHQLAISLNKDPDDVEEVIYQMLASLLKCVGKHKDLPDEDFHPDQLQKGIKIEMEHTNDPYIAKLIAKDHLKEIPDYYDHLEKMERDANVEDYEY